MQKINYAGKEDYSINKEGYREKKALHIFIKKKKRKLRVTKKIVTLPDLNFGQQYNHNDVIGLPGSNKSIKFLSILSK
jgi:hypothetical protein